MSLTNHKLIITSMILRRVYIGFAAIAALLSACSSNSTTPDAWGNFEADEVTISAEANGRLIDFSIDEGDYLTLNQSIGLIDTVQLSLRRSQLYAQVEAAKAKRRAIDAQIDVQNEQVAVITREQQRVLAMFSDGAATQKQLDDINGQLSVLTKQIEATKSQQPAIDAELKALGAQVAQVQDQLAKCKLVSYTQGTVLVKYANTGELVSPAKPLYRIALLDPIVLKAYISGSQLHQIALGKKVTIGYDADGGAIEKTEGTIIWISAKAEFTPKIIQTREERVDLVYPIKIKVSNPNQSMKIGMPGEVWF